VLSNEIIGSNQQNSNVFLLKKSKMPKASKKRKGMTRGASARILCTGWARDGMPHHAQQPLST